MVVCPSFVILKNPPYVVQPRVVAPDKLYSVWFTPDAPSVPSVTDTLTEAAFVHAVTAGVTVGTLLAVRSILTKAVDVALVFPAMSRVRAVMVVCPSFVILKDPL